MSEVLLTEFRGIIFMDSAKLMSFSKILIFLGMIFSFYLVYSIPDDVFYSGDGGLKALLVQQYNQKNWGVSLELSPAIWVERISKRILSLQTSIRV